MLTIDLHKSGVIGKKIVDLPVRHLVNRYYLAHVGDDYFTPMLCLGLNLQTLFHHMTLNTTESKHFIHLQTDKLNGDNYSSWSIKHCIIYVYDKVL